MVASLNSRLESNKEEEEDPPTLSRGLLSLLSRGLVCPFYRGILCLLSRALRCLAPRGPLCLLSQPGTLFFPRLDPPLSSSSSSLLWLQVLEGP